MKEAIEHLRIKEGVYFSLRDDLAVEMEVYGNILVLDQEKTNDMFAWLADAITHIALNTEAELSIGATLARMKKL